MMERMKLSDEVSGVNLGVGVQSAQRNYFRGRFSLVGLPSWLMLDWGLASFAPFVQFSPKFFSESVS